MSGLQSRHPTRRPDIATHFVRWSWLRAALHSGYWLVTSLYLVLDARLSPFQLVLIGFAQGIVSLLFEIPTGVMADTISRKWSLVIFHILLGTSMVITGLVTPFPALGLRKCCRSDATLSDTTGGAVPARYVYIASSSETRRRVLTRPVIGLMWWAKR